VLAKGGVCVYSGLPQDLKRHLNECDIECTKHQVPIEVMLKISSNGKRDEKVQKLSAKASQMKESLIVRCNNETLLSPNGIQFESKRFLLIDIWYLLLRTFTYTIVSQWRVLIVQTVFYQVFAFYIMYLYEKDISKSDGCVDIYSFQDGFCKETAEKIESESLWAQNIKYNSFMLTALTYYQLATNTMSFSLDVKNFLNEHQNGML